MGMAPARLQPPPTNLPPSRRRSGAVCKEHGHAPGCALPVLWLTTKPAVAHTPTKLLLQITQP